MGRPTGVTLIAVLYFIAAAFCVLGGIGMMLGGGFIAAMINQAGGQGAGAGAGILAGLGAAIGIVFLVIAAIQILVAVGLLKLKEWARIVGIVFSAIGGILQLLGVLGSLAHFTIGGFVWNAFWLGIDALIIWYLLKPDVKAAFGGPQARGAAA
jgi:hypothetical protein